jgi:hypothetical protein
MKMMRQLTETECEDGGNDEEDLENSDRTMKRNERMRIIE